MDQTTENIREELRRFSSVPSAMISAKVLSIQDDDTITVRLDSGLEIDEVRLKSVVQGEDKIILVPKNNTSVLIARIENSDEFVVVAVEEISRMYSRTGSSVYDQNSDGFLFKKGNENLCKILIDLLDAITKERHNTNQGPTIKLTPVSLARFEDLKIRVNNLLKND